MISVVRLEAIHSLSKLGYDGFTGKPNLTPLPTTPSIIKVASVQPVCYSQEDLDKHVRSWAIWSLLLGVVHLVANQFLNPYWGILLIVVGLISFYFRASSMFVVYAVTLLWAAFSNATSGGTGWVAFSLIQLIMVFSVLRDFFRFRNVEKEIIAKNALDEKQSEGYKRALEFFPHHRFYCRFVISGWNFLSVPLYNHKSVRLPRYSAY